ncbi:MAG: hypothetical protein IKV02_01395, partial [Clostridia bacterium]|nr:hypothetical protein [Clostridia bacterium]
VTHPSSTPPKTQSVLDKGSHFASKAMGACSQEPRAKIFATGEIPGFIRTSNEVLFSFSGDPSVIDPAQNAERFG